MKKIILALIFVCISHTTYSQITEDQLVGIHSATETVMNSLTPNAGALIFNTTKNTLFIYDGTNWVELRNYETNTSIINNNDGTYTYTNEDSGTQTIDTRANSNPFTPTTEISATNVQAAIEQVSNNQWGINGNSNINSNTNFLGTTNVSDLLLKTNNTNRLIINGSNGQVKLNGANNFNNHPLVIRANATEILAFQDSAGNPKWHWNIYGDGLNFVESTVADYRLFLKEGGNVGINTNTPTTRLDVNGNFRIRTLPAGATTDALVTADSNGNVRQISKLPITNIESATANSNKFLTTNATGVPTWEDNQTAVRYVSINEFVRTEPVLQDTGRIMFTVHQDLANYKTSKMTVSIQELGTSGTLTVQLMHFRNGTETALSETVSFNSGTTYTGTSAGTSNQNLLEGDILYLNITGVPAFEDAPKGLTATIKLTK